MFLQVLPGTEIGYTSDISATRPAQVVYLLPGCPAQGTSLPAMLLDAMLGQRRLVFGAIAALLTHKISSFVNEIRLLVVMR